MNMQDKEFDDLFRSKLDDFETEPTAQVWINIDAEMDGKKRKKGIFFTLKIAASVILLLTAGILFIPKKDNTIVVHHTKNQLTQAHVSPAVVKPGNNTPVTAPATKDEQVAVVALPINHITRAHHTKKENNPTQKKQVAPEMANAEHVKVDEQPVLITSSEKPAEVIKSVVPGIETPLAVKQVSTNETNAVNTAPVLASTQTPATTTTKQTTVKKRGIHNMGDLVNLVLAKVDKRKDKVIEFTDIDDESTITAVNLGPIKIKKEDK
jgi:hypothetical protein